MKIKKVKGTRKSDGTYYLKYAIPSMPKSVVEKSGLEDKELKAEVSKGKIILKKK